MKNLSIEFVHDLGKSKSEVIERKGIGHPDTIADALAENLSVAYARYTVERFGAIMHHNFDKLSVLGGTTEVDFGEGRLTSPIRIILNGRASVSFAGKTIPVRKILEAETYRFFHSLFGTYIDPKNDIAIHWFVSNASSPGRIKHSTGSRAHLFTPRDISEVKGYDRLLNNDTSIGCGYAPLSPLERTVLGLEEKLNSRSIKQIHPWLGTDIKVMATKADGQYAITVCLPEIACHVPTLNAYRNNLESAQILIQATLTELLPGTLVTLHANTRDDFTRGDIYLTAIGSSIESGDEGIVGRGNRVNGLITPLRAMNLEGACGKNPKYYSGKLYNIAAKQIAERLHRETNSASEVILVSQAGRPLTDPWTVMIRTAQQDIDRPFVAQIVEQEIERIPKITEALLLKKIRLY